MTRENVEYEAIRWIKTKRTPEELAELMVEVPVATVRKWLEEWVQTSDADDFLDNFVEERKQDSLAWGKDRASKKDDKPALRKHSREVIKYFFHFV